MAKRRRGRLDRNHIPYITDHWIQTNVIKRITKRDIKTLKIVHKRGLITRDQLSIIHDGFRSLKQRIHVLNRRLRILYECMCINKAYPPKIYGEGNNQAVLSLDKVGASLINVPYRPIIKSTTDKLGYIQKELPKQYKHTLGINDFECKVVEFCNQHNMELLRWRIAHQNKKCFALGNKTMTIIPDGFGVVKLNIDTIISFFLEYDTGTEDIRNKHSFKRIKNKLYTYVLYYASKEWLKEDWALFNPTFPYVFFITEDDKRIAPLKEFSTTLPIKVIITHKNNVDDILNNELLQIKQLH